MHELLDVADIHGRAGSVAEAHQDLLISVGEQQRPVARGELNGQIAKYEERRRYSPGDLRFAVVERRGTQDQLSDGCQFGLVSL
jgi:hypothetical protein